MKYTKPLNDSSYPARNGSYVDADASTGVIGSTVPGAAIEAPQREIVQVIEAAGLTPDDADRTQLLQALNSPWQIMDVSSVTRAGDNSITLTGDTTSIYPKGRGCVSTVQTIISAVCSAIRCTAVESRR